MNKVPIVAHALNAGDLRSDWLEVVGRQHCVSTNIHHRQHAALKVEEENLDDVAALLSLALHTDGDPTFSLEPLSDADSADDGGRWIGVIHVVVGAVMRDDSARHAVDIDLGHAIEVVHLIGENARFEVIGDALGIAALRRRIGDRKSGGEINLHFAEAISDWMQGRTLRLRNRVQIDADQRAGITIDARLELGGEGGVVELAFVDPGVAAKALLDTEEGSSRSRGARRIDGSRETDVRRHRRGDQQSGENRCGGDRQSGDP